ncbi:hypothetical protein [Segetibacter aerophilus]|uniref:Alpha-L-rhamnosidase six-hairpin glycosidase domain-containing protein n=1 Tax=Segetibacter aerophilus TaxID=670293 RepID=A0A512B8X1_9BACT|nr:hypothetical protein [Segetibacter aerophilus]GEO08379.1 hypothetical protein SAE01_08750 [Segetibacter aerophilus]
MLIRRTLAFRIFLCVVSLHVLNINFAQTVIVNSAKNKTITFGNRKIKLTLDYNQKANVSALEVNGQKVIDGNAGIYSEVRTASTTYSSLHTNSSPALAVTENTVRVSNVSYGNNDLIISETWKFIIRDNDIKMDVERTFSKPALVEEVALPSFNFNNINTWEGAYQGYGGLAWFYLFNEKLCTYGVHTNSSRFWNSKTGNGLKVSVDAAGKQVAMKYSRTNDDHLKYAITVSDGEMIPRFDSGTNRKRFIRQRTDVWSAFNIAAGKTSQCVTLSYFDFNKEFDRGKFVGVNGEQVSSVLNTVARIGVIDAKHFGGNSWHTPYGPICLHEQYIAQMGLAINDNTYLQGYKECLDYYRDNAIKRDGRVWARWAYNNVDIMPGQVTDKGFYEAQWGFLMDSNPDLVTNVADLFDQTGDRAWVKTHQRSCEKALDWIINRDSDKDGLVEMMTDSYKEKRGSDWIDIIWAAYENAFVNAKLYHALTKWTIVERELGNTVKAQQYQDFAAKLKTSFNKSTTEGGFWDDEKKCYVHWLDKDKSVHGRNMVTPVNFMAIAYGICDDDARVKTILDDIETQMKKENLFFWPLTMSSYADGEGRETQYPFPSYENGDLFLSWGAVGVKAYADYKPELALKYVTNVMDRYAKDGLAYQRYGRKKQDGLGDDILSGNSLSVVGLYHAIYGINPLYNRFYLNPHITSQLAGTQLKYNYQGQKLLIDLDLKKYTVSNGRFKITSDKDFGFSSLGNQLFYFNGNTSAPSFIAKTGGELKVELKTWSADEMDWIQNTPGKKKSNITYTINQLAPNSFYTVTIDPKQRPVIKSNTRGSLTFDHLSSTTNQRITITKG